MIRFTTGNLLDASADALVNTVNEVGVMGKGIALMFKERFPENTRQYTEASKRSEVRIGRMLVTETGELFPKWIINFPTKRHWRNPSQLPWIEEGLRDLVRVVREHGIRSLALPPLGCGNGGLSWTDVRPLIESAATDLPNVELIVYEPTDGYFNAPKVSGVETLTIARALIAEMIRRYSVLGIDCTVLEVQKLAYFLQQSITRRGLTDVLALSFVADQYGPYADRLRHLLNGLDGSFLHAERRLSDASPFNVLWLEVSKQNELRQFLERDDVAPYLDALEESASLIDGFESPLGMELLATVHWLLTREHATASVGSIRERLAHWPAGPKAAARKLAVFDDRLLGIALHRLVAVPG